MKRGEAIALLGALTFLAGCSLAPPQKTPQFEPGTAYQELGAWTVAQPADRLVRDDWWRRYGDAQLDDLQHRLESQNPTLAAALATYDRARAVSAELRAGLFPTLTAQADVQRLRQSDHQPLRGNGPAYYGSNQVEGDLTYELDFWGKVRNQVASGRALAVAAGDDLESARLSLRTQLTEDYLMLRGYDREIALLDDTVNAYDRAVQLTQDRHRNGIAPGLDVARAQTELETARSQVAQTRASRALAEHAIAALVGEPATQFRIDASLDEIPLPSVPAGVPSELLQRRPDVAAAERRMAAANAQIGVARAAYFPSFTLDAAGGFISDHRNSWLSAPSAYWAVGPSLALTLFDAGRRHAQVEQARAALDEAGGRYREASLSAFQQVEDSLALLNHYHDAYASQRAAVDAAQRTLDLSMDRYRHGATNYLDVVTAQAAALQSQRDSLSLETRQLRASVELIRAVGGGWGDPANATAAQVNRSPAGGTAGE